MTRATDEMIEALGIFAQYADYYDAAEDDIHQVWIDATEIKITVGDLRRARAARQVALAPDREAGAPSEDMLVAGARSIGNTISHDNHIERARACWNAMNAARSGVQEPVPQGKAASPPAPVSRSAGDAQGWAILDKAENIVVSTVSLTQRAAKVNWLCVSAGLALADANDEAIEAAWNAFSAGRQVVPVRIAAARLESLTAPPREEGEKT